MSNSLPSAPEARRLVARGAAGFGDLPTTDRSFGVWTERFPKGILKKLRGGGT
jgi:hypothetical protein